MMTTLPDFLLSAFLLQFLVRKVVSQEVDIPLVDAYKKNCGRNRLKGGTIVNGVVAGEGEFPWLVSLQLDGKHFCAASIISERWLISASHCFTKIITKGVVNKVVAVAGTNDIGNQSAGDRYAIEKLIRHEAFNGGTFFNDIALLRSASPIALRKSDSAYQVNTICLPPYNTAKVEFPPATADVAGWGYTDFFNGEVEKRLRRVTVSLIEHNDCYHVYADKLKIYMSNQTLCYGKDGKDSCSGDSGGSLVKKVGPQTTAIGLVSFGRLCAQYPGVYTNIVDFRDWIAKHIY